MVRIGGGVFPEIKERDYLGADGSYRIDDKAGKVLPLPPPPPLYPETHPFTVLHVIILRYTRRYGTA